MEKNKNHVYGGKEARELIGLPDNGDAIVNPFNHSMCEVFVESRSTNRILPRGTKLLIKR